MTIALRSITDKDKAFLIRLFGTTREDELAELPLGPKQKETFIKQQYAAQQTSFSTAFPSAKMSLIVENKTPIGRLYVNRGRQDMRVIDISILPDHRSQGIGRGLMKELQAEATKKKLPVSLHVDKANHRAMSWYQSLGFVTRWMNQTHYFMAWPIGANVRLPDE